MPGLFWSSLTCSTHKASLHDWLIDALTHTQADITTSEHRAEVEKFHHSPLKRGCPSSVISGNTTLYSSSENPGLHGGVPLPSAAICDGGEWRREGGATMSHKSTFKNVLCCFQNLSVTFCSPHTCTKASVVLIAGTAIRIMRPKGLSISQKAWLGKNKLHLSPWRGPGLGKVTTNLVTPSDRHTTLYKHSTLKYRNRPTRSANDPLLWKQAFSNIWGRKVTHPDLQQKICGFVYRQC